MATGNSTVETSGKKKAFEPLFDLAKTEEQGSAWAMEYFECLKQRPDSLHLTGLIEDLIDADNIGPLNGFCEKLQELIVNTIPSKVAENSMVGRPVDALIESALEMATEIREERSRFYALATTISANLKPRNNDDSPDYNSFRLAEVLEELLNDCGQQHRLIQCLEALLPPSSTQPPG